jgi:hypothetical protein
MSVKYQNFLTIENAAFCQKLAASENVDIVGINTDTKNTIICYRNGVNVPILNDNLQRVDNWVGGLIVYKILNQGEPIPEKLMSEYRKAKANEKLK